MHDVIVVSAGAKPGNQATPMPKSTASSKPSSEPTTGW
jgi:hypothetical protein